MDVTKYVLVITVRIQINNKKTITFNNVPENLLTEQDHVNIQGSQLFHEIHISTINKLIKNELNIDNIDIVTKSMNVSRVYIIKDKGYRQEELTYDRRL